MQIDVSTHEPSSTWFNFGSDLPVELRTSIGEHYEQELMHQPESTQLKWVLKQMKLLAEKKISNDTIYTLAVILARI